MILKKKYLLIGILFFISCDNFTYIPKSKKKQLHATPSILLLDRMVDFRVEYGGWPISRTDFISKGIKYYEAFNDFPYQTTGFKIKDSNNMVFYFSGYISDVQRYNDTKEIDLNAYNGTVKFWKQDGKFLWKIKMK